MRFTKKELTELIKEELDRKNKINELESKKNKISEELTALGAPMEPEHTDGHPQTLDEWVMLEEKKKPSAGLSKKKRSAVVKAAKAGKDIGKKGKGFKGIEAKAKKTGAKDPKAVAAAAMWKNIPR